jgi:hypothetical protein
VQEKVQLARGKTEWRIREGPEEEAETESREAIAGDL